MTENRVIRVEPEDLPNDTAVRQYWATQCLGCRTIWFHCSYGGAHYHMSAAQATYQDWKKMGEGCDYCIALNGVCSIPPHLPEAYKADAEAE